VLVTSAPLLAELRRVLTYPRIAKVIHGAVQLADLIAASSVVVTPGLVIATISDESDNLVLEAAVEGAADYIVSGDTDLLDIGSFRASRSWHRPSSWRHCRTRARSGRQTVVHRPLHTHPRWIGCGCSEQSDDEQLHARARPTSIDPRTVASFDRAP
jgi:putative PIN family toxin of toxin-antitoxin system